MVEMIFTEVWRKWYGGFREEGKEGLAEIGGGSEVEGLDMEQGRGRDALRK